MIKGAIFDLDGTLFDSMFIWENAGELYLRSIGLEPRYDTKERFNNATLKQSAQYIKEDFALPLTVEEIADGINKVVEGFYFNEVQLKDGVSEFLSELKKREVKMCIATATDRYQVEAALKRCNVDKYFSEIFTCTEIGIGKSDPTIFRAALKALGTPKEQTVVFEDAYYAIKTAKTDGFRVTAVYDMYEKNAQEVKALSDCYITDYRKTEYFWNKFI